MGLTLADIHGYISSVAYMQPGISLPDIETVHDRASGFFMHTA